MTKVTYREAASFQKKGKRRPVLSGLECCFRPWGVAWPWERQNSNPSWCVHSAKGAQRGNLRTCHRIGKSRSGEEDGTSEPGQGCSVNRGLEWKWFDGYLKVSFARELNDKWGQWGWGLTWILCAFVMNLDSRGNLEALKEGFEA